MRPSAPKSLLALALAAGLCPLASFGQKQKAEPVHPAPPPRANRPNAPVPRPNGQQGHPNHPGIAMPEAVARWNAMPPDEQKKALARMPPEQQKRFRERITAFNQLPKEEQLRQTQRYERFSRLPPAQQQAIRRDFQQLNTLPPDRKQAIGKELARLEKMSGEQRGEYFAGDQFRTKFSPGEQEMLQNLSKITPHQN